MAAVFLGKCAGFNLIGILPAGLIQLLLLMVLEGPLLVRGSRQFGSL